VHLVVDDQAPVAGVEQLEVRVDALPRVVITWYVAMVTGRISLRGSPEYSPISSSVSEVRLISSSFHCRAETVLVTRISVVACACGHRGRADDGLAGATGQHDDAGAAVPERLDASRW
jgi:hypothetical protein